MGLRAVAEVALAAALVVLWMRPAVHGANAGVCYKKVQFTSTETQGEYVKQQRVYYERCWLRKCTKYRIHWQYVTLTKPVTRYRTESECCPGYARASEFHDCEPVCKNDCPERQECVAPDKCACRKGYLPKDKFIYLPADSKLNCLSPCEIAGCQNGVCVNLETCICYPGYSKDGNGECAPVCSNGCGVNAECFAPDKCRCLYGFEDTGVGGCKRICKLKLRGAECVDTERYACLPGYVFDKQTSSEYLCSPVCAEGCLNGQCIAPDTCACLQGYERANSSTCVPICENVCSNGDCVAPDTCRCHEGYELDPQDTTNSTCEPTCQAPCVGGACTAPNVCTCYDGYEGPVPATSNSSYDNDGLDYNSTGAAVPFNNTCLPVCLRGCHNGICEKPETCSCLEGYDFDPSDDSNSTCVLTSQSLALCDGEECASSGEAAPTTAVAAGVGVGALLLLTSALLAALYWMKRRKGTIGGGNYNNPSYSGGGVSVLSAEQLLEESCVDEDGIDTDN